MVDDSEACLAGSDGFTSIAKVERRMPRPGKMSRMKLKMACCRALHLVALNEPARRRYSRQPGPHDRFGANVAGSSCPVLNDKLLSRLSDSH